MTKYNSCKTESLLTFIPKLNLIVEIKSWYTEKMDKNVEQKKGACVQQGFKYIRIVDNNFSEFISFMNITGESQTPRGGSNA